MGSPSDNLEPEPEFDDGDISGLSYDDISPQRAWLSPDDRLWRHPSEWWESGNSVPPLASVSAPTRLRPGSTEWGRFLVTGVVAGLVAALVVSGLATAEGWWTGRTVVRQGATTATSIVSLSAQANSASQAATPNWTAVDNETIPSVVAVTVSGAGGPQQGSGVVLATSGGRSYLATDLALFAPGEQAGYIGKISLTTMTGQIVPARLVGEDSDQGVAVVSFSSVAGVPPALTGSVADIQEASTLLAVGARGSSAVSLGVVSSTDRVVNTTDGDSMYDLVEISSPPTTPAGRGSPLVNQYGQVVAITVSVAATSPGDQQATFAVPIDTATLVTREVLAGEKVVEPWTGATDLAGVPLQAVSQIEASGGVRIGQVLPYSPAEKAGVQPGDVILSFDGTAVTSAGQVLADVCALTQGTSVPITLLRNGHTIHTTITVAVQPQQ